MRHIELRKRAVLLAVVLLFSCARLELENIIDAAREIRNAEVEFKGRHGKFGSLEALAQDGLIETRLSDGTGWRHRFDLSFSDDKFQLLVTPLDLAEQRRVGNADIVTLFVDESGIIRAEVRNKKTANATSDPIHKQ